MARRSSDKSDAELLARFAASFAILDDMAIVASGPNVPELATGETDAYGWPMWRPEKMATDASALAGLKFPVRFPPLFEQFLLSWRWLEVDLAIVALLRNPPGSDFSGFRSAVLADRIMSGVLLRHGFLQFGRATGGSYDPVCFDTRKRWGDGECPVIRLDHEEILCNSRIQQHSVIAGGFRELVGLVLEEANRRARMEPG